MSKEQEYVNLEASMLHTQTHSFHKQAQDEHIVRKRVCGSINKHDFLPNHPMSRHNIAFVQMISVYVYFFRVGASVRCTALCLIMIITKLPKWGVTHSRVTNTCIFESATCTYHVQLMRVQQDYPEGTLTIRIFLTFIILLRETRVIFTILCEIIYKIMVDFT